MAYRTPNTHWLTLRGWKMRALVMAVLAGSSLKASLGIETQASVASVAAQPALSAWRASHGGERAEPEAYDFARANQWCATSVAEVSAGMRRAASFFVPEVTRGALPQLPSKEDAALMGSCMLGAIWLEARGPSQVAGVVREVTEVWGAPSQSSRRELSQSLFIRGSGYWRDVFTWRRGRVTVWVAWTDWDKGDGAGSRTIVWILRDRVRDVDPMNAMFDTTASAVKIANLEPALTPKNCGSRLPEWLAASRALPADRHAAALLAADSFVACALANGDKPQALGVKLEKQCPQDDGVYANNLREEAKDLDPKGPAGALAALASLQSPCSLKGSEPWPDRVVEEGRKILAPGPWSPWVRFAVARAHDVKLWFSMPPGEADLGGIHELSAAQARRERSAAIAGFAQFIREEPDSDAAVFAWQEAWRLLAGLAPSAVRFGCGCE